MAAIPYCMECDVKMLFYAVLCLTCYARRDRYFKVRCYACLQWQENRWVLVSWRLIFSSAIDVLIPGARPPVDSQSLVRPMRARFWCSVWLLTTWHMSHNIIMRNLCLRCGLTGNAVCSETFSANMWWSLMLTYFLLTLGLLFSFFWHILAVRSVNYLC